MDKVGRGRHCDGLSMISAVWRTIYITLIYFEDAEGVLGTSHQAEWFALACRNIFLLSLITNIKINSSLLVTFYGGP